MVSLRDWNERGMRVERMLGLMHLLAADAMLYRDDHARFQQTLQHVRQSVNDTIGAEEQIELKLIQSNLIFDEYPLQKHLSTTDSFRRQMQERGVESVLFRKGITEEELLKYAHFMRLSERKRRQIGSPGRYLRSQGVKHIRFNRLLDMRQEMSGGGGGSGAVSASLPILLQSIQQFQRDNLQVVDSIEQDARVSRVLNLDAVRQVVEKCLLQANNNAFTFMALKATKQADDYSPTHSLNTCALCLSFARYLGVDKELLPDIGMAALLHDIGKTFIPRDILEKPGKLSTEEWELMENHTTLGARFLIGVKGVAPLAPVVAYEHHMQFDLSGYPRMHNRNYVVTLAGLITTMADFYDAITTDRPYKRGVPPYQAVDMMSKFEGSRMEPRLKRLFVRMLGPYPVGTLLKLQSGEMAVVSAPGTEEPYRPGAILCTDATGRSLVPGIPVDLNSKDANGAYQYEVEGPLDPLDYDVSPHAVLDQMLSAGEESTKESEPPS